MEFGYRIDILVENSVIIELKTAEEFNPVFEAQVLTYLKFSEKELAYLLTLMLNF